MPGCCRGGTMRLRRARRRPARIEMLPLIDIVFLLLVFFIYAMLSMAVHRGMDLDLPDSSLTRPSRETPLSVSIGGAADGYRLYLNREEVSERELAARLAQACRDRRQAPAVLLFADRGVDYQHLFRVLDLVRRAGIEKISLQARQIRQK